MRKSFSRALCIALCFVVLITSTFPVQGTVITDISGLTADGWSAVESPDHSLIVQLEDEPNSETNIQSETETSAPDNINWDTTESDNLATQGQNGEANTPVTQSPANTSMGHSSGKSDEELLLEWLQSLNITQYQPDDMLRRTSVGDTGAVSVSELPVNSYNVTVVGVQAWGSIMAMMSINSDPAFCLQLWKLAGTGTYTATNNYDDLSQTQIDAISKYLANYAASSKGPAYYAATQVFVWEVAYGLPRGGSSSLYARMISGTEADQYTDTSGFPVYLDNNIPNASARIAAYSDVLNGNELGDGILFWSDGGSGQWIATEAGEAPDPKPEPEPEPEPEFEGKVGYLEIAKYDGTNNLPLGGAVFRIECDGFIDTAFSVPYGGAVAVIPIPDGQDSVEVTVTEVTAPYQYALNSTPKTVTVTAGDIVNVAKVSFVNYPLEGCRQYAPQKRDVRLDERRGCNARFYT